MNLQEVHNIGLSISIDALKAFCREAASYNAIRDIGQVQIEVASVQTLLICGDYASQPVTITARAATLGTFCAH